MLCMCVDLTAMQGGLDLCLECRIVSLGDAIEVYEFGVHIVYHLAVCWLLGKEDGTSTAECFGIEGVFWNEWEDMLEHCLLTSVVGYGCFEFGHFRFEF